MNKDTGNPAPLVYQIMSQIIEPIFILFAFYHLQLLPALALSTHVYDVIPLSHTLASPPAIMHHGMGWSF